MTELTEKTVDNYHASRQDDPSYTVIYRAPFVTLIYRRIMVNCGQKHLCLHYRSLKSLLKIAKEPVYYL
jgi:hypothetical protein